MRPVVLTPHKDGIYSSFPTFVTYKDKVYLFYREGIRNFRQVHGLFGKVKRMMFNENDFINLLQGKSINISSSEDIIFADENELDAIVSKLEDNLFALCTRVYLKGVKNICYVSFSSTPDFTSRTKIKIKDIILSAFYGKAFKSRYGYIFPAYGVICKNRDEVQRPLLLVTDGEYWDILAALPTKINGNILNETSLVFYKNLWHAFVREDNPPYGIWHFVSDNLLNWDKGKKLFFSAHAPMAFVDGDKIILAFRYILSQKEFAIAYSYLFEEDLKINIIEYYQGNCFDGGYCDIGKIKKYLVILYYHDSGLSSPVIKGTLIH
ncbi:MAG: hypothetical protein Q9M37_09575 [Desulfonauticus sp.]|nr:hypothetical protein [Desulfonauticus sp.]